MSKSASLEDPWFSGSSDCEQTNKQVTPSESTQDEQRDPVEYNYNTRVFREDAHEYIVAEYQRSRSASAESGKLLGTYKVICSATDDDTDYIINLYAEESLCEVKFAKRVGDRFEPGETILTATPSSGKDKRSLFREETRRRVREDIFIEKKLSNDIGLVPTKVEFLRWHQKTGSSIDADMPICSIAVHLVDVIFRVTLVASTHVTIEECHVDTLWSLNNNKCLGVLAGQVMTDKDSLYYLEIDKDPDLVSCVPLENDATHWLIKEWHCTPGNVEEGSPICTFSECNKTFTYADSQIVATDAITITEILAEPGCLLEAGDGLMRIKEFIVLPASELLCVRDILPSDTKVTFAPLYEGNTHCKVLTISDALAKGSVKQGEEIMRLECFENNDTSKVECIAKLIALLDLDDISSLVEIGEVLKPGCEVISAPIFEEVAISDAVQTDLNDGFVRFAPLYEGNTRCKVLTISDAFARGSIKKDGELMKLECYGAHDNSEIRFIGTLIALRDLESIDLEVKEGEILEPGERIFFAPVLEKMQAYDAIRVEVNSFTIEGQKSLDTTVSCFREAKSFDATMILSRLRQHKKLQLQNLREVSNKRNATISAGTALASVAATATGFGAVASILSLLRVAYQSSHKNADFDNDLEQGLEIAEGIRQLLTNQRSRLGEVQGRFIGVDSSDEIRLYCVTQSAARGVHLIELDFAGHTDYLESEVFRSCLANTFNDEELAEIWGMLLPTSTQAIKGIRLISPNEALDNDKFYQILSGVGNAYRAELQNSNRLYLYKLPIPHHSDF